MIIAVEPLEFRRKLALAAGAQHVFTPEEAEVKI